MSRLITVFACFAACGALAAPAFAQPPNPSHPAGNIRGVVPTHGQATKFSRTGSNLSYHNGPVMRTNSVRAIYWFPSGSQVSANYTNLIDRFFKDVATDSGKASNVYFSDTQYYDITGSIAYSSSYAGGYVDTNPFPASGCTDRYTSICLTDSQLQTELQSVIAAKGWQVGTGNMYFIFTPANVGSCAGSSCAFSYYCAYHSQIGSGPNAVLYANQPYAAFVPSACGSGQSPNGDDADSTINVVSHEHNEAITDPLGSAWYDRQGYENGDKCAWNFGSSIGSTSFGQFNQQINGNPYYLQQEWSNAHSRCVLTGT